MKDIVALVVAADRSKELISKPSSLAVLSIKRELNCYALTDDFKLRFLWFELFHAAKAAQRFGKLV